MFLSCWVSVRTHPKAHSSKAPFSQHANVIATVHVNAVGYVLSEPEQLGEIRKFQKYLICVSGLKATAV